jgi:hypothetical protein
MEMMYQKKEQCYCNVPFETSIQIEALAKPMTQKRVVLKEDGCQKQTKKKKSYLRNMI